MQASFYYAPNFFELKELSLPPLSRELFGLLANLAQNHGQAYICRKYLAEKLNSHKNSISNALKRLIDNDLLQRTGEYFNLLFPYVRLTAKALELTRPLPTCNQTITPPTPSDYTNKNKDNIIKEQQQEEALDVDLFNKLIFLGVGKSAAKSWLNNRPLEIIKKQVEHLESLLAKNVNIQNKAGWLNRAIKENYDFTIEEEPQEVIEEPPKTDVLRQQRILELKQIIPQKEQERIFSEELEKQKGYLHKLGLRKVGPLAMGAAMAEMERRLLELSM